MRACVREVRGSCRLSRQTGGGKGEERRCYTAGDHETVPLDAYACTGARIPQLRYQREVWRATVPVARVPASRRRRFAAPRARRSSTVDGGRAARRSAARHATPRHRLGSARQCEMVRTYVRVHAASSHTFPARFPRAAASRRTLASTALSRVRGLSEARCCIPPCINPRLSFSSVSPPSPLPPSSHGVLNYAHLS